MGINTMTIDWLVKLKTQGFFSNRPAMLELGPQDICAPHPHFLYWIDRLTDGNINISDFFEDGKYKPYSQAAFYNLLGVTDYKCCDTADPRRHFYLDLNKPVVDIKEQYNVITNFGTAEHIFNIAQVFITIDQLLADDGIVIHILPSLGDINHGFWNIHPTVYFDIAHENGYEIIDFTYMDNALVRVRRRDHMSNIDKPTNFDSLPIKVNYKSSNLRFESLNPNFNNQVTAQMFNTISSPETRDQWGTHPTLFFDYSYVVMRKIATSRPREFKFPTQSVYR